MYISICFPRYAADLIGWERLAGLAGQPSHINTVYVNQPAVLLSHVNEPATIRTSQPNRLKPSIILLTFLSYLWP